MYLLFLGKTVTKLKASLMKTEGHHSWLKSIPRDFQNSWDNCSWIKRPSLDMDKSGFVLLSEWNTNYFCITSLNTVQLHLFWKKSWNTFKRDLVLDSIKNLKGLRVEIVASSFYQVKKQMRFSSLANCVVPLFLIHLTLKYQLNTLLSLVNGSPRTTAFIIEIPELSSHTAYLSRRAQRYSSSSSPLLQCMILHCIAYHTFSPLFSVMCQHNSFPSYDSPLQKDTVPLQIHHTMFT